MNKISTSKHCYACGKQLTRNEVYYSTENLLSYCKDYYTCKSSAHPNSTNNERLRGGVVLMIPSTNSEVMNFIERQDEEVKNALLSYIGKAISLRVTPSQAHWLVRYAAKHETKSTSETIQRIIDLFMKIEPLDYPINYVFLESYADEPTKQIRRYFLKRPPKPEPKRYTLKRPPKPKPKTYILRRPPKPKEPEFIEPEAAEIEEEIAPIETPTQPEVKKVPEPEPKEVRIRL